MPDAPLTLEEAPAGPPPLPPELAYRDGTLAVEGVSLAAIAAAVGTPVYVYSSAALEERYRRFAAAFADPSTDPSTGPAPQRPVLICYAVKANGNRAVIRTLARLGAGADVVSEGELRQALAAGVPPERIVFSGVGKTAEEMGFALAQGIHQINVESEPELLLLDEIARRDGRVAPVAIRINPDVDARTHAKISTGKKENKFGIELGRARDAFRLAAGLRGIALRGVAVHIGSQLTEIAPFELAFERLAGLVRELRQDGIRLDRLDLGGGVGVRYRDEAPPDIAHYARMVKRLTRDLDMGLSFEPGRFITAAAGVLVARVLYAKEGVTRRFLVLDAAMNDLIRPALYDAWHPMVPVREPAPAAPYAPVDVVGPICETGDSFAAQRPLPPMAAGDMLALLAAGAYGAAMSSTYNLRRLPAEVMVRGDRFAVVRPRQSYEALLGQDQEPDWLR